MWGWLGREGLSNKIVNFNFLNDIGEKGWQVLRACEDFKEILCLIVPLINSGRINQCLISLSLSLKYQAVLMSCGSNDCIFTLQIASF